MNRVLSLHICGEQLEGVDKYVYLGINLDNTLSFKPHIERYVNGCNQRLFSLAKIRRYIPAQVAVLLYKPLVMSKLN